MKHILLLILAFSFLSQNTSAQTGPRVEIDLQNTESIQKNLLFLRQVEADFWVKKLELDSAMIERVSNNTFSIYMQYVEIMKQFNYSMEKILLTERYNFNIRRDRFMNTFLSDAKYKKYKSIVAEFAKKDLEKYTEPSTELINHLRKQAAGWNVINQTIKFK